MEPRPLLRKFFRHWYQQNHREFPWRRADTTPFGVLVAEMLLRQTRAEMVAALWPQMIGRFPAPQALLDVSMEDLREMLRPLGLSEQRAVGLQAMALALVQRHGGKVPRSLDALLAIPHVGLYAAHAVLCFAYGRRVPVVDVNVMRVLSRIAGEEVPQDNRRSPHSWAMALEILPRRAAKEHNYGLLDFSALICTARAPKCPECPLVGICFTGQRNVRS